MPHRKKTQQDTHEDGLDGQEGADNVIPLFGPVAADKVPPLTDAEVLQLRQFLADFAIIRATCPMAIRALSKR